MNFTDTKIRFGVVVAIVGYNTSSKQKTDHVRNCVLCQVYGWTKTAKTLLKNETFLQRILSVLLWKDLYIQSSPMCSFEFEPTDFHQFLHVFLKVFHHLIDSPEDRPWGQLRRHWDTGPVFNLWGGRHGGEHLQRQKSWWCHVQIFEFHSSQKTIQSRFYCSKHLNFDVWVSTCLLKSLHWSSLWQPQEKTELVCFWTQSMLSAQGSLNWGTQWWCPVWTRCWTNHKGLTSQNLPIEFRIKLEVGKWLDVSCWSITSITYTLRKVV